MLPYKTERDTNPSTEGPYPDAAVAADADDAAAAAAPAARARNAKMRAVAVAATWRRNCSSACK